MSGKTPAVSMIGALKVFHDFHVYLGFLCVTDAVSCCPETVNHSIVTI